MVEIWNAKIPITVSGSKHAAALGRPLDLRRSLKREKAETLKLESGNWAERREAESGSLLKARRPKQKSET